MTDATPLPQPPAVQPFATWNPTRGVWETSQPDLYGHLAPYSETWPTSGTTHDGSAYPLPQSARRIPGSASSSSPTALFRTPLASDSARGGESLEQVRARRGTIALSHQIIDLALHGPSGYRKSRESETLWWPIGGCSTLGTLRPRRPTMGAHHRTPRPSPNNDGAGPRPAPDFVEWLMGLPHGWVTDPNLGLTHAQHLAALGNGVLPAQAAHALAILRSV
jgi:hypothetical protein